MWVGLWKYNGTLPSVQDLLPCLDIGNTGARPGRSPKCGLAARHVNSQGQEALGLSGSAAANRSLL